MGRFWGGGFGAVMLALVVGGCAAPASEGGAAPEVEDVGVHAACIDPCTTTYEVRLAATVGNSTYRPSSEITPLVLGAVRTRLATRSDIDVDEGRDRTTSPNAKYLAPSVTSLTYASGNLSATVQLGVFTYPGLDLLGSITKRVTMAVQTVDVTKENLVISTAATQATQTFIDGLDAFY